MQFIDRLAAAVHDEAITRHVEARSASDQLVHFKLNAFCEIFITEQSTLITKVGLISKNRFYVFPNDAIAKIVLVKNFADPALRFVSSTIDPLYETNTLETGKCESKKAQEFLERIHILTKTGVLPNTVVCEE